MGLFRFLRRSGETVIPEPGTAEFEEAVRRSALPDAQSVSMGEPGWASIASRTGDGPTQGPADSRPERDSGEISESEFEAQKRGLLG